MITRHHTTGRTRPAFTLVELMVAMALTMGIMVIITEAFQKALDFTSVMNANKDLMNQLANAGNVLEHDLTAEHFLQDESLVINGQRASGARLSDQRLDLTGWRLPRGGFFKIYAPAPQYEPFTDREGNALSTATNHVLHFTSIFKGGGDQELFSTAAPAPNGTTYKSRAAEVAWYLVPTNEYTSTGAGRMQLYDLVRRYRLVALDDSARSSLQPAVTNDPATHAEVISVQTTPTPGTVNTLATVMNPANRFVSPPTATPAAPLSGPRFREEVVLTNVLSFQVLPWWDALQPTSATRLPSRPYGQAAPMNTPNTEGPYDYLINPVQPPYSAGTFDTHGPATNPNAVPQRIRIRSLQITIRIANTRAGVARSNTWRFAM